MMHFRWAICVPVLLVLCAASQDQVDLSVALMQSTFMLEGRLPNEGTILGTGFLLMRALPGTPDNAEFKTGKLVLVTAAHVFEGMTGDTATIHMRVHDASQDRWVGTPAQFKIRDQNGAPLWKKHPSADVAVLYVRLPFKPMANVVPTSMLADDSMLQKYSIGPGVELNCLGYPLGDRGIAGFPILRTGVVASYPLLPTKSTKSFLFDFRVFGGNSGGPVYFEQQNYRGGVGTCCGAQFIMGLVTDEDLYKTPPGQPEPYAGVRVQQLSIAWVVHSSLITEAINLLPSPELPESKDMMVPIELVPTPPPHAAR